MAEDVSDRHFSTGPINRPILSETVGAARQRRLNDNGSPTKTGVVQMEKRPVKRYSRAALCGAGYA